MNKMQTFVRIVHRSENLSQLWATALDRFHALGIERVSFHSGDKLVPGSGRVSLMQDGYPEAWVCEYVERRLSQVNPIPDLAVQLARPFLWSNAESLGTLSTAQREFLSKLAARGIGDGLAIPVFGPNMRTGTFGLGFGGNATISDPAEIFQLQCAAQVVHLRYCELTRTTTDETDSLSPREREVLRWLARGKSNTVIAEIMGVSRHTVDTMTRRVFEKLNVNDRTTAAIKGLGAGLLQYHGDIAV